MKLGEMLAWQTQLRVTNSGLLLFKKEMGPKKPHGRGRAT